jgi:hypothetical protein
VQRLDDGAVRFVRPDGEAFTAAGTLAGRTDALLTTHADLDVPIDAHTVVTCRRAERIDFQQAVDLPRSGGRLSKGQFGADCSSASTDPQSLDTSR